MEVPNNFTYQIYTLEHNIQWIAYAANPTFYSIHDDAVTFQNGDWESLEPIITNVDGYGIGEHEVTLVLYNSNSSTIRHKVPFEVINKIIPIAAPINEELMFDESIVTILIVVTIIILIVLTSIIKKYNWLSTKDGRQDNGTN